MHQAYTMNSQKNFHIAPMLDVSKPEFLNFVRILSKRAILWTEMVVDETIVHSSDLNSHLPPNEPHLSPIICQIGGRNAEYCGKATSIVESYGYDEVNLNIDCPSSRVSGKRKFGAILMHDKETAFSITSAMKLNARSVPISVKTRVGIELDDGKVFDTMAHLIDFIDALRLRGCRKFIIHARRCVIGGLSPAQNRLVPPLNYPRVYKLCQHFPDCEFVINGGIPGLKAAKILCDGAGSNIDKHTGKIKDGITVETNHNVPCSICKASNGSCTAPPLISPANLTGVMLGRALIDSPSMFWDIDKYFYGEATNPTKNRREVLEKYCQYLDLTYPRRCCDDDDRITSRIPAPKVIFFSDEGCDICRVVESKKYNDVNAKNRVKEKCRMKMKITSHVIDRSLKPILNIFFGLRHSKKFRRECERLRGNKTIRNCGPAFILRSALLLMPNELLDQPFEETEALDDSTIPRHVGPVIDSCKSCR